MSSDSLLSSVKDDLEQSSRAMRIEYVEQFVFIVYGIDLLNISYLRFIVNEPSYGELKA